jgi:NAD-dependent deacetylase
LEPAIARRLRPVLDAARAAPGRVVFLTGAGISAESGIPTFRGETGYWRVGSRHYQPQELATLAAFRRMPDEVWAWYLHRRSVCRAAAPNAAHLALVDLERRLGDRFLLVTQNVDGLHLRAGSSPARTFQIHGNLDFARCAADCGYGCRPLPEELIAGPAGRTPQDAPGPARPTCPGCGDWLRPHVLWFDECYDEAHYRFESSLQAAATCAALVIVGSSGATNLPRQMAAVVARRGTPMVVIDPEASPFSELATNSPLGCFVAGTAVDTLPALLAAWGAAAD